MYSTQYTFPLGTLNIHSTKYTALLFPLPSTLYPIPFNPPLHSIRLTISHFSHVLFPMFPCSHVPMFPCSLFSFPGSLPFTLLLDDPAGNSFVENLVAPNIDPQLSVSIYFNCMFIMSVYTIYVYMYVYICVHIVAPNIDPQLSVRILLYLSY
jgi:uncharacterized Zn-finger protein